jgi:hypothetical protein
LRTVSILYCSFKKVMVKLIAL